MDSSPGVTQQKISIPNKDNDKLVGVLHNTGSPDIVVLCHGYGCTKENEIIVNLASALAKEGISAFRFDFAGVGESEGTFKYCRCQGEAEDLHSVVEYFTAQKLKVAAIVGHSKGGDVALLYASKDQYVHTVVNVSARYDVHRGFDVFFGKDYMQRLKTDGFIRVVDKDGVEHRVTEEEMMDQLSTDMHEACAQLDKSCRVLTIHGSKDEINPVEDALEFDKVIPNHKLHIIEGADHFYKSHQTELVSIAISFIMEGLK
ncbi:hypothetical protein DM860_005479 [Cuscuta australis]|uniref:Serine aminopeptidase S33 domain-containing protein n=1 Tax=Cuscuta australis TaxID=267555 RepID=A0A328E3S4_9ASTE|nr:hypothetical protein DM860_005479 [Cuscuta australis]